MLRVLGHDGGRRGQCEGDAGVSEFAFDAEVHLPAIYGTVSGADDDARLGRRTNWIGDEGEAVVGVGRRSYVMNGEDEVDIMAIESISFSNQNG